MRVPLCFAVLCLLCLCARHFIYALLSPAGKGLTSWLSFVVSNCEFVTFPLVSWVRCGSWLYRFLIFAPLLTSIGKSLPNSRIKPRMHVRRSIKYEKLHFFARTGVMKTSTVACGFTPIKIHYSDYPKRINEVYVWRYLSFIYSNVYCGMV